MTQESEPSADWEDPFSYNSATPLQRDLIIELAQHYPDGTSGVQIRRSLEDIYGDRVKKATFYMSVDRLVDRGLVTKHKDEGVSGREHKLRLTDECIDYLEEYINWCLDRGFSEMTEVDE